MIIGRLVIFALLSAPSPAQDDCATCGTRGTVACARHGDARIEAGVAFCSVVAACETCAGAGALACRECARAGVAEELAGRGRAAAARLARIDRETAGVIESRGAVTCASADVRVTVAGVDRWCADVLLDSHAFAHHCLRVLEVTRADFLATFGLTGADLPRRGDGTTTDPARLAYGGDGALHVWLLRDKDDARRAAPRIVGLDLRGLAVLTADSRAVACVHLDARDVRDDEALRGLLGYLAARLLLAQVAGASPGDGGHGWLEAGLAHVFEARAAGRCGWLGFGEIVQRPTGSYRAGDWRAATRRLLEEDRLRTVAVLVALQHEQLDLEAHAQAFTFVEFLLSERRGEVLLRTAREVAARDDALTVLRAAYPGQESLDSRYRSWVLEHCPR